MGSIATSASGWSRLILMFAVPMAVIGLLRMIFVKEKYDVDSAASHEEGLKVKDVGRLIETNKYILIMALMNLVFNFVCNMGVGVYYFTYIIGNVGLMGVLGLAQIIAIPLAFVFPKLISRFSTVTVMFVGFLVSVLSPFLGPEEELASLPMTGENDKTAFCLTHGAYYVESNMGSAAMHANSDDNTMTHRSSAASAEFSRVIAQKVYGYEHRPYGYVYGGSGGGYRTTACIENTNAFDGAAPYVIGSPYAIPNCQTTRAYAEWILLILRITEKFPAIWEQIQIPMAMQ